MRGAPARAGPNETPLTNHYSASLCRLKNLGAVNGSGLPVKAVQLSAQDRAGFSEGSLGKLAAAGIVLLQ